MPGTPDFAVGASLTAISVTPLTRAANGTFSAGATVSILGTIEELGHTHRRELEDINTVVSTRINMVPLRSGHASRITCLKNSQSAQTLSDLNAGYSFALLGWTQGIEVETGYYTISNYDDGTRGRGAQRVTMDFEPCDPGQAQTTRA